MGRLYLKIDRSKKITSRSVSFKCCSETIPTLSVVLPLRFAHCGHISAHCEQQAFAVLMLLQCDGLVV